MDTSRKIDLTENVTMKNGKLVMLELESEIIFKVINLKSLGSERERPSARDSSIALVIQRVPKPARPLLSSIASIPEGDGMSTLWNNITPLLLTPEHSVPKSVFLNWL
jgi:hypothetical protein